MILLDATNLAMTRPGRPLFSDVSLTVSVGDRLGVIGINGTGKSTLLGLLAGRTEPEQGAIRRGRGIRTVLLDQTDAIPQGTVAQVVGGGWEGEAILDRLGMGRHLERATNELSGGETKRVALARALVDPGDLLLLDEPTNHLDLDAITWLENHLAGYRGGLMLVTHDRHLLDRVTNKMLELDRGQSYLHDGGYASYLDSVAERQRSADAAEAVRANLARSELAWLRRGAPARTSKPKARIAKAEALLAERPTGPARAGQLHLEWETPRLGDVVIELADVGIDAPDGRPLVRNLDLALDPRERLGIVGPNGIGKSTLLDVMAGLTTPALGQVTVGATASVGYYRQSSVELDPAARVRDVIAGPHREPDWTDARLAESFWFDTDAQWSPVELLSGGERRRLHLLTVLAAHPNVLLLDEPTNDLDLETLRSLEDFLEDWPGAVVVVSHDRAFLERVVADALVIENGEARRWPGGFGAWDAQRRKVSAPTRRTKGDTRAPRSGGPSASTLNQRMRQLDKEMAQLAGRKEKLEAELVEAVGDHRRMSELGIDLEGVMAALTTAEEQWLELADQFETRS